MPCRSINGEALLAEALHDCAEFHIDELPVVDGDQRLIGLVDLQDLANRGFDVGN